jgi:hypothetical protein
MPPVVPTPLGASPGPELEVERDFSAEERPPAGAGDLYDLGVESSPRGHILSPCPRPTTPGRDPIDVPWGFGLGGAGEGAGTAALDAAAAFAGSTLLAGEVLFFGDLIYEQASLLYSDLDTPVVGPDDPGVCQASTIEGADTDDEDCDEETALATSTCKDLIANGTNRRYRTFQDLAKCIADHPSENCGGNATGNPRPDLPTN